MHGSWSNLYLTHHLEIVKMGNHQKKQVVEKTRPLVFLFGRDEATRTPDPYVPNVVRYQLRYIPIIA